MLNDAGVAILGGAEHISTNTEDKFTYRFISSIDVLRIKENFNNGKTGSPPIIIANRRSVNKNFQQMLLSFYSISIMGFSG